MSQTFSQDKTRRFEFEGRKVTPIGLIIAGVFLLSFVGYYGYIRYGFSAGYCISMLAMLLIMVWVFYFRAVQLTSDLVIDDHGISRFIFFIKCYSMRWHDVKQIRTLRQRSPGDYKLAWFVFVYPYNRTNGWNPSKPAVVFTDRTSDREKLELLLNHYVKQYRIKVFERAKIGSDKKPWREVDGVNFSEAVG